MTDEITKITDRMKQTVDGILKQFKNQPSIEAKMASFGIQIQEIEDMFMDLYLLRWLENAEGVQLDRIGNMIKEKRGAKNDANYKAALYGRIVLNKTNSRINDLLFGMDFVHEGSYQIRELGRNSLICRLMDAKPTSIDAETLDDALQKNRGGGVGAKFQYSSNDADSTFRWASGSTVESTTTAGWANAAKTTGGKWSDVV